VVYTLVGNDPGAFMADSAATRAFLASEVEALEPFDFLAVRPALEPQHTVEITRSEGSGLEVRIPGRPPILPALDAAVRTRLNEHGFRCEDPSKPSLPWVRAVDGVEAATGLCLSVLAEVFEEKPDARLDFVHGSHRAEHEAEQKIAELHARLEPVLKELAGANMERDADQDYALALGDVRVTVAPRAVPGGPSVVRVFAVTNVGVVPSPDLGIFLARLNFGLMFGRFALDTDHHSIWFDATLLGEHFSDEELRFTVQTIAETADAWDDRLKQMFGGVTYQEFLRDHRGEAEPLPAKPGMGGYL
jgi:hypothetical protein